MKEFLQMLKLVCNSEIRYLISSDMLVFFFDDREIMEIEEKYIAVFKKLKIKDKVNIVKIFLEKNK